MRTSTISTEYKADIKQVWDIVTDNRNYGWRSDLLKIEISEDGTGFTEITKDGFRTNFKITAKEEYRRYEFDMENKHFKGHWVGLFSETPAGGTRIVFREELNMNNPLMAVLSYIFLPLKKIQRTYGEDLRKALGEA